MPENLEPETVEKELTFLGLVALIDPPRSEASQAVADCLAAGITPVMITGDAEAVARTVAAELGIDGYGTVDLERLLRAEPDQLFTSAYAPGTDSLAQRQLAHPALRVVTQGKPLINIDYRFWICGGPMLADAVEALAAAHPESK